MPPETKIPSNSEIDQALKEFEAKSSSEPVPQSGEVPVSLDPEMPKMVKLVIKYSGGLIKEQKQAEYVLLAFAALIFAVSLYFFFSGGTPAPAPAPAFDTFVN